MQHESSAARTKGENFCFESVIQFSFFSLMNVDMFALNEDFDCGLTTPLWAEVALHKAPLSHIV
jgi:hypothetical protein